MLGEHVRFAYWHALRYLLYSRRGWNKYINALFRVKGKIETGTVDRFDEIYNNCWSYRNVIYYDGTGESYDGSKYSHDDLYGDYSPGKIEFCNANGETLATVQMSTSSQATDDRFDMPNSRGEDLSDEWCGFNPEVLEFNCVAPRMHAMIYQSGTLSFFRIIRCSNPELTYSGIDIGVIASGSIGLVGSGCDLELPSLDVESGKILKITKFQLRLT